MTKRQWTAEQKVSIVLERIGGRTIEDICTEHGIRPSQLEERRDQFLSNASKAYEASIERCVLA